MGNHILIKLLIRSALFVLIALALYFPRVVGNPDLLKHQAFAGMCTGCGPNIGDTCTCDYNDPTVLYHYTVTEICINPSCTETVNKGAFDYFILKCHGLGCGELDPKLYGGICYDPGVAPRCASCQGVCAQWQTCTESNCFGTGTPGCDCQWRRVEGVNELVSVSGQHCVEQCGTSQFQWQCQNSSSCSWVDTTGQCATAPAPGSLTCNNACGTCLLLPPSAPPAKTCSITSVTPSSTVTAGTPVTVAFSGNNNGNTNPSDTARLWVEKWPNSTAITPAPSATTFIDGTNTYYQLASCVSSGSTACTGSATIATLPAGTYYVHCDLPTNPVKCSGNPQCSYENLGGTSACTGWQSCSTGDNSRITINPPPVTLRSRAVVVSAGADCAAVRASANGINGAVHSFTVAPTPTPAPQTQSGASYVNFTSNPPGANTAYTLSVTNPSPDYVLRRACWTETNPVGSGTGQSVSLNGGETVIWDMGYSAGSAWAQTKEGNVYASGTIRNLIPSLTSPRVFNLDSASLYPGVVTYGTDYDFDSLITSKGANLVSSKNWLVNQTYTPTDYYDLFYHRFGSPTTPDSFADLTNVTKPASRATPYYVVGDTTTNGNWTVGSGENIVFLVNGNLTIGGNINITGTGFVAFIVKGDITVSSSVGGLHSSSAPVVEGMYVTGTTRAFQTLPPGGSITAGKERFVGKGMFVAGSFSLGRDLDSLGQNITTSAELFLYNPQLLFTMPDYMKDVPVTWQEVAP